MDANQNMNAKKDKRVPGVKCVVRSCGASRRTNSHIRLFQFPSADTVFGQIWREKCQISENNYEKNFVICSRHFEDTFLGKRRLKGGVVPTLHLDMEEELQEEDFIFPPTPKKVERGSCKFCANHVKAYRVLTRKYKKLEKKYENLRALLISSRRKKPIQKRSKHSIVQSLCSTIDTIEIGAETKTFVKLLLSARQKQYSSDVKFLALNLYFKSPSTYNFLRDKLNLHLPHVNTLRQWSPIKSLQPGLTNSGIGVLAERISKLKADDANHMVLVFDEMAIRKNLKYNTHLDLIDGFESNGLKRTSNIGKQVCVFLIKCLYTNWSSIVNYLVSSEGLSGETLSHFVIEILKLLTKLGVTVRIIVCDQASSNRKFFSLLGVTIEKPYFEFEGIKIFVMFDFPHLLKSLRNGWLECDLITPDGQVSFQVVKTLYEMEKNKSTKMCTKLTAQHIFPNSFEKMRVKFASQIFSHTVQAAIRTINDTCGFKNISKELATSTANFIQTIDRVFDCMNSGNLYADNLYRSAIQLNNTAHNFIKHFSEYLNEVKFTVKKRVYFLDGMKLTLHSVLLLVEDFLNEHSDHFFIMTKALNQDCLENTFSVIRQMGGNNNNPTVAEINTILAKTMTTKILRSTSIGNCENEDISDISDILIPDSFVQEENFTENISLSEVADCSIDSQEYPDSLIEDVFENSSTINLELTSARYFVGFVAYKKLPKMNCTSCSECLVKADDNMTAPSEFFLFHKNYQSLTNFGNLVAPSDLFMEMSKQHIMTFHKIFRSEPHKIGLKAYIIEQCKKVTPNWFINNCSNHRLDILDYMITVLIRKHCSWLSHEQNETKARKLKIIKN